MTAKKVYTIACPGSSRYEMDQRNKMQKDDKRLHQGCGWYSDTFPATCPKCGDQAQSRGMHWEVSINGDV